jgi:hypothetical protein
MKFNAEEQRSRDFLAFYPKDCNGRELIEPQRRQERKELKLKTFAPFAVRKIFNNL